MLGKSKKLRNYLWIRDKLCTFRCQIMDRPAELVQRSYPLRKRDPVAKSNF